MGVYMVNIKTIDREWLLLIMEAKNLGLTKDEIRIFLKVNQGEGSAV
jgi:Anti-repressor SinI